VIPAKFDYEIAESAEHAISLLGGREGAKLLAGGHSLIPAMKLRLSRPSLLVDVGRIGDLGYVRDGGEHIAIGALTRHREVHDAALLQEQCPIVAHTAGLIGDPQVRHRGTIGGTIAYGDPASDMPAVILALDGELVVRGPRGERVVPASDFFIGVFHTAIEPGEMLVEVRVPKLGRSTGWSYLKMSRRAQDWATVAVAAVVERNGSTKAAIGLTNMGATPLRAIAAEEAMAGGASIEDAAGAIAEGTDPPSDQAASAEFRLHLAGVLGRRALEEAMSR
jgi:aerobic carbon-monoxide dehydrogenase medium subunit